jgi:hypothetical protein
MNKVNFYRKDIIIIVLAVIIVLLFAQNVLQKPKVVIYKNSQGTASSISKKETGSIPNQNPIIVAEGILSKYNTCVNTPSCPLTPQFRSILKTYIKNVHTVNPITREAGALTNPQVTIVTELPKISILKVQNSNQTNIMEFDLVNKNNSWELNATYCFQSPQTAITTGLVPLCK